MKTKGRIQKINSTTPLKSQPANPQSSVPAAQGSADASIAYFNDGTEDGIALDIVHLSKKEVRLLEKAAKPQGKGLLMFMADAALEKARATGPQVERAPAIRAGGGKSHPRSIDPEMGAFTDLMDTLDQQVEKVGGFLALILNTLDYWNTVGIPNQDEYQRLVAGWLFTGNQLRNDLTALDVDALNRWYHVVKPRLGAAHPVN